MSRIALAVFLVLACATASVARPLVIAHRGASGYLPEHTLEAYTLAFAQGADLIEPDVVLTRDGVLICAHDLVMDDVTDVADRFPGRARDDGKHYWIDFDLDEIKTLTKTGRGTADAEGFQAATFDEMLSLVRRMNRAFGRDVGVIPEPKSPGFHRDAGQPIEGPLLRALSAHGWSDRESGAIVQCFDLDSLRRMRGQTDLPLVWLFGRRPSDEQLERAAAFVDGIGPNRRLIGSSGHSGTGLMDVAERLGLSVYPYTFYDERDAMAVFFHEHRVDGLFTDYPDVGRAAADQTIDRAGD